VLPIVETEVGEKGIGAAGPEEQADMMYPLFATGSEQVLFFY